MGLGLSLLASTADLASELATIDAVLSGGGDAALLKKALNMGDGSLQMGVLEGRAELRQNATDAAVVSAQKVRLAVRENYFVFVCSYADFCD